ncbi:MAG: EcoAI/FtnUII family type I restriction enzme subunit R [Solirubrobacterales bacterium]
METDTCRDYIVPALRAAGWRDDQIVEQRYFTDGRVIPTGRGHRRGEGRRTDYLLEIEPGQPIGVVEAKREYKLPSDGLQQAMDYAEVLGVGFAYSSNGEGIVEHDYDTGAQADRVDFPSPDELWGRHLEWRGITAPATAAAIALPFNRDLRNPDGTVKEPRYYQSIAINRAVEAIVGGQGRALLTMATGTGKTFVSLQIVWKLWTSAWKAGRKPRILYLADRNILIDQPIAREFRNVFGDAIWKVRGEAKTGREVYFALYQALAESGDSLGLFRDYPNDYFDLVIVDECHRGSARDESSWRGILEHFAPAAQLGMTATPLRADNRDTYAYFGNPLYEYSLADGIEDGFLAPYHVKRVVLSPDAEGWAPDPGQLDRFGKEIPEGTYGTRDFERVVSLLERTRIAARHLTEHLKRTGRFDKTIVFCVDSEHAEQMRRALHEVNADLARQFPHYVARIVADEGDVGRELLDRFADPEQETPVIATTSKLLGTGVDIPTCRNVILMRPIGSMVEFKQIIGRGARLYPDRDKLWFQIVDYVGATSLFADPDFDGVPERIDEEAIDEEGRPVEELVVEEPAPPYEEAEADLPDPDDLERAARKYYVDEGEVFVTADSLYVLDPQTGDLRIVAYEDYASDQVRKLYPRAEDLRGSWREAGGRDAVVAELDRRGITLEELAERTGLPDADPFDLLVHIAWNAPVMTRRDRVSRLRREHADFIARFSPEAREVLDALLEKYADHGIDQIDDLGVLNVPPLSDLGTPIELAGRFGGGDELREAARDLGDLLYAA